MKNSYLWPITIIVIVVGFIVTFGFIIPPSVPKGTVTNNPEGRQPVVVVPEGENTASSTGPADTTKPVKPIPVEEVIGSEVTTENLFKQVNKERVARGAQALKRNYVLDLAAQAHVDDMFAKGYFAQVSPTGVSYADFIKQQGYIYSFAGENVAACCKAEQTTQSVVAAWLASPTHLANLEAGRYTETGFAARDGMTCRNPANNTWTTCILIVQMFGSPK